MNVEVWEGTALRFPNKELDESVINQPIINSPFSVQADTLSGHFKVLSD